MTGLGCLPALNPLSDQITEAWPPEPVAPSAPERHGPGGPLRSKD